MAVMDDLLDQPGPEEEIVGMSVRDRYLVGRLALKKLVGEVDDLSNASGRIDTEETDGEVDASTNQSLIPSSIGFTFCVDGSVKVIELIANWGGMSAQQARSLMIKPENPFVHGKGYLPAEINS